MVAFTICSDNTSNHLAQNEIEPLFLACYQMHDHSAKRPQQPIMWLRTKKFDIKELN